jgi:hypothetical protein
MTAMGLAMGAQATSRPQRSAAAADRDLARAAVLLESAVDATWELACAHIECATAYDERNLWELEFEHYNAVESALRGDGGPELLAPAIRFNRAEAHLNRLMALRELGLRSEIEQQASLAAGALADAGIPSMPQAWREELQVFALLIGAITPGAIGRQPLEFGAAADGLYAGYVHLAHALAASDRHAALEQGQAAVSMIDPVLQGTAYNLSLCTCAEIEEAIAGRPTAGLRYPPSRTAPLGGTHDGTVLGPIGPAGRAAALGAQHPRSARVPRRSHPARKPAGVAASPRGVAGAGRGVCGDRALRHRPLQAGQ